MINISSENKKYTPSDTYDNKEEVVKNEDKNESMVTTSGFSVDDWMSDIEEIKKEIQKEQTVAD